MREFLLGIPSKLNTLLTRLSSTRAGYLDNIPTILTDIDEIQIDTADMQPKVATINTRINQSLDNCETYLGVNKVISGYVDSSNGGMIDSAVIGIDRTYKDVTIASVDPSKCIVDSHGIFAGLKDHNFIHVRVYNSTTVRCSTPRGISQSPIDIAFTITEFY